MLLPRKSTKSFDFSKKQPHEARSDTEAPARDASFIYKTTPDAHAREMIWPREAKTRSRSPRSTRWNKTKPSEHGTNIARRKSKQRAANHQGSTKRDEKTGSKATPSTPLHLQAFRSLGVRGKMPRTARKMRALLLPSNKRKALC